MAYSKKPGEMPGFFEVLSQRLVDGVDDVISTNQHHRDADKQRNKKNGHKSLLSVVALGHR